MKLIYLTAKTYPATTADHFFVLEMAKAFANILHDAFTLVVANDFGNELRGISVVSLKLKMRRGVALVFYWWVPYFIFSRKLNTRETVFFSGDRNLLRILILYKRIFKLKYKIVSDWHMLFDDEKDSSISHNSDGCIATSEQLKQLLVGRCSVSAEKVLVARGGVALESFNNISDSVHDLRTKYNRPLDAYLIGYVGQYKTMGMEKGLNIMIGALALMHDENIKMAFVGGAPEEIEEYKKMAEDKGVADRVIFIPKVANDEVSSYEKAMDILVIPYPDEPHFRDYGFPMKAYEYMASKRPILYSSLPIIAEVLGDCATSFTPGDPKDMADKILHLKSNPAESERLSQKAYSKVADFTWSKRAGNIIAFLKTFVFMPQ